MSDSAAPPLHLGPSESEVNPLATEGGGLTATPVAERGRKRSPSPLALSDDEDLSDGEWLLSGSDEDEDQEDKGIYQPFTVDDIPRPSCDHKQQTDVLHKNPETKGVARLSPTGPARVISMITHSFIEFEIHARNEDETNVDDDLIIEGCTEIDNFFESKSFIDHRRFYGERCALDIKYIVMINAVEALVEVTALHLDTIPGGVNMKLYAKTSGFNDVIPLFQGIAPEPGDVMIRFAVGVERHNCLDLYIEGSQER